MLYHASPVGSLTVLTPHASNHGKSLVYFSQKRENVLVYLSNAVEKYCRDTGFVHTGRWEKWGPYGFDADGVLLDEKSVVRNDAIMMYSPYLEEGGASG